MPRPMLPPTDGDTVSEGLIAVGISVAAVIIVISLREIIIALCGKQTQQQQQAMQGPPQPQATNLVVALPTPAMQVPQQQQTPTYSIPAAVVPRQQTPNSIPAAAVVNINVLKFKNIQATKTKYFSNECAICLVEFKQEDFCRILSKCQHLYHQQCIDLWLEIHSGCPLCRGSVRGERSPNHQNSRTS